MNIDRYLQRIDYQGPRQPTLEVLDRLHHAHMLAVPFENLDIHLDRRIELSLPDIYEKIVNRQRGGFCYELNGLFGWLLQQLGYEVTLLSAGVYNEGIKGPEFAHMLLHVDLDEPVIVDVGFGDSFIEPLPLSQRQENPSQGNYRFIQLQHEFILQKFDQGQWISRYGFTLQSRTLDDFTELCDYQQTSARSRFTLGVICSRATPQGRITLSNDRLIITTDAQREEHAIVDETRYRQLLLDKFAIRLSPEDDITRLMQPDHPACR